MWFTVWLCRSGLPAERPTVPPGPVRLMGSPSRGKPIQGATSRESRVRLLQVPATWGAAAVAGSVRGRHDSVERRAALPSVVEYELCHGARSQWLLHEDCSGGTLVRVRERERTKLSRNMVAILVLVF